MGKGGKEDFSRRERGIRRSLNVLKCFKQERKKEKGNSTEKE